MLGAEAMETVAQVLNWSFQTLEFEKLDSSINLLKFSLGQPVQQQAVVIMNNSFQVLLQKFEQSGVPKSSLSEEEKSTLKTQYKFIVLMLAAIEVNPGFLVSE